MFDLIQLELARQGEKAEIIYLFNKAIKYVYKVTHDGTQTGEELIKKLKIRNCYEYGSELPESIKTNLRICKYMN